MRRHLGFKQVAGSSCAGEGKTVVGKPWQARGWKSL
jgi:hypothetical protein